MGSCVWSGVVVVMHKTKINAVGVAMGFPSSLQTIGAGFLLVGGFLLEAGRDENGKWLNFFIMVTFTYGHGIFGGSPHRGVP
ncbi:hypothetical protein RvY_04196 [Ramazzottius varieornatus]|uniref:Uncharacterized protein n=1 Tax=Ramazzottius varieornatus TaxID=947166 RepID=A0A1D1URG6_RAMVA|nr:hypothetical protein RvY_04196 [Ramazzottius varieornatus]